MADYDVIIIGGNTPALVTASYLAKDAGLKVAILERSKFVGGTAMTVEMYPGYKFSPAATGEFYVHPKINHDLELTSKFGLTEIECNPTLTTAFGDGNYLSICPKLEDTAQEFARYSQHDAEALVTFMKNWGAVGQMFGLEQMNEPPKMAAFVNAMSSSVEMERMCRDMLFGTPRDILDNYFENDYVKASFLTLCEGSTAGPSDAPFFFCLGRMLHPWGFIKGGLVQVARTLETCAKSYGVEIITEAEVTRILTKNGEAYGVETADGQQYNARIAVVSEIEPPTTFNKFVDPDEPLPADFKRGLKEIKYECGGVTLNLALDALPDFGFPEKCYNGFFGITKPGYQYAEEAFAAYKCQRIPDHMLSMTYIPSYYEEPGTFAPEGHHVLTGYAFPVNYFNEAGAWNQELKEELLEKWIDSLDAFAPGLKSHVIHADGYTPQELDDMFVMTHGDLGHGTLRWYDEFNWRPMPGYSNYRSPIKNLYMGGQSVHPLSGVGGVAGSIVAKAIIDDNNITAAEGSDAEQFKDRW